MKDSDVQKWEFCIFNAVFLLDSTGIKAKPIFLKLAEVCMGNGKGNPEFYVAEIQLGAHSMPVCINNAPTTAYHTAPLLVLVVPVMVPG